MIGRAEVQVGTWRPGPDALEGGSGTQRFAEELDLPGRACVDGEIRESVLKPWPSTLEAKLEEESFPRQRHQRQRENQDHFVEGWEGKLPDGKAVVSGGGGGEAGKSSCGGDEVGDRHQSVS